MPFFAANADLPPDIQQLPEDVQTIFRQTANRSYRHSNNAKARGTSIENALTKLRKIGWVKKRSGWEWMPGACELAEGLVTFGYKRIGPDAFQAMFSHPNPPTDYCETCGKIHDRACQLIILTTREMMSRLTRSNWA